MKTITTCPSGNISGWEGCQKTVVKTFLVLPKTIIIVSVLFVLSLFSFDYANAQDPGEPSGNGVEPEVVAGNPSCAAVYSAYGLKIDAVINDQFFLENKSGVSLLGGPVDLNSSFTISKYDGIYFDWSVSSNCIKVLGVIVKGGPNADVYNYYPINDFTSDSKLHAPINPSNGTPYGISHIEFCYEGSFNIECPVDLTLECDASTDPADTGMPTLEDGCDIYVIGNVTYAWSDLVTPGNCANEQTITRTWTATDENGTTATCVQTLSIVDTKAPVPPTPPADASYFCADEVPLATSLTASDNCDGDITVDATEVKTEGSCANDFTLVRTWTFTDVCGNSSSVSQTITVKDETAPVPPTPPADAAYFCADEVPLATSLTASDNCDGDITVNATEVKTEGSCANDFTLVRTWTFTDVCGNSSSVSQTITVKDETAPVPPTPPADASYFCADDIPAPVSLTAIDNCDDEITVAPTAVITPGQCANDFTLVRTWTFTDVCGNSSSVSQTITVKDETAPVPPAPPADVLAECADDIPPIISLTATDNCDDPITVLPTINRIPGSCVNDFIEIRTWTFTDICGNSSSVSQKITVKDVVPPVPPTPPADLVLACADDIPAPVSLTATDNCDDKITVAPTGVITPGQCANDFTLVRTWTFKDACGNSSSINQKITVKDVIPPTITPPQNVSILCNVDFTDPFNTGGKATATDNCSNDLSIDFVDVVKLDACGNGTITRTWTATDVCQNSASAVQIITINDCGDLELLKTTNGVVDASRDWIFKLYQGYDQNGTLLATESSLGDGSGILFENVGPLSASEAYTICETNVMAGWTSVWKVDSDGDGVAEMIVPATNPDFPEDFGNRCITVGAGTGYPLPVGKTGITCTLIIAVDNSYPGGDPRTPGYWKNWNRCTSGGQADNADRNGGYEAGYWLLDDILNDPGITLGNHTVEDCAEGVAILDQRDFVTDKKKASDPIYTLAMHLLAAKLNFAAGASTCQAANDAAIAADLLLIKVGYNATGDYLKGKNADKAQAASALELASILDAYNNGQLCNGGAAARMIQPAVENQFDKELVEETTISAYPNPFSSFVVFDIRSMEATMATLEVFNLTGVRIGILFDGRLEANEVRKVEFNTSEYADGMLIYRFTTNRGQTLGKMISGR